jgi:hypothetical protein
MTNAVAMSSDFQERLYQKIRDDIGSLMTDVEIKALVEKTMERVFFSPQRKANPRGWGSDEILPSRVEQIVKELIEPSLVKAMKQWFDEHPEMVQAELNKALSGGLVSSVARALDSIIQGHFSTMQYNMQQALEGALRR